MVRNWRKRTIQHSTSQHRHVTTTTAVNRI